MPKTDTSWQPKFIEWLANGVPDDEVEAYNAKLPEGEPKLTPGAGRGNVDAICKALGIGGKTAYVHRTNDKAFADQWDEAKAKARKTDLSALADTAIYRAIHGYVEVNEKQKFEHGKPTGEKEVSTFHRHDNNLLIKVLSKLSREEWGDRLEVKNTGDEHAAELNEIRDRLNKLYSNAAIYDKGRRGQELNKYER